MASEATATWPQSSVLYRQRREFCIPPSSLSALFDVLPVPHAPHRSVTESQKDRLDSELQKLAEFRSYAIEQLQEIREKWIQEIDRATREIEGLLVQKCEEIETQLRNAVVENATTLDLTFGLTPVDLNGLVKQFVNISLEFTEPTEETQKLYKFFGGFGCVCVFDPASESLSTSCQTFEKFFHNSVWVSTPAGEVYITGGSLLGKSRTDVLLYRPKVESTELVTPMWTARRSHAIAYLDNTIYVFGGISAEQKLFQCESMNLSTRQWTSLPSMSGARAYHCCAVHKGRIYVMGGCDLSGIEVFAPDLGTFVFLPIAGVRLTEACSALSTGSSLLVFHGNYQGEVVEVDVERGEVTHCTDIGLGNMWSSSPLLLVNNAVYAVRMDSVFKFEVGSCKGVNVARLVNRKRRLCNMPTFL